MDTQHAVTEKQGGRSRQAESNDDATKTWRQLTDGNDDPQDSNGDVVTYQVVIARSWREKKNGDIGHITQEM